MASTSCGELKSLISTIARSPFRFRDLLPWLTEDKRAFTSGRDPCVVLRPVTETSEHIDAAGRCHDALKSNACACGTSNTEIFAGLWR